jgi:hypothetical protein
MGVSIPKHEVHSLSQQDEGLDPSQASEQKEPEEQVLLQRAQ